mmetsp:Transcript_55755/g.125751  ORF Transcript_55755/g.125751 Transcript_55755/m.125751 type:complete len:81 (+) Transcript_55755:1040-1282(+)
MGSWAWVQCPDAPEPVGLVRDGRSSCSILKHIELHCCSPANLYPTAHSSPHNLDTVGKIGGLAPVTEEDVARESTIIAKH